MKEINDFLFELSISERGYCTKPTPQDYEKMKFRRRSITTKMFLDYIRNGYSFCHVYRNDHRSKANFLYTYCINIDVDDAAMSLSDFLARP